MAILQDEVVAIFNQNIQTFFEEERLFIPAGILVVKPNGDGDGKNDGHNFDNEFGYFIPE
jgi:hypothetical protein